MSKAPFNLKPGNEVKAEITAENIYGESDYSKLGKGAFFLKVPDPPKDLSNNNEKTNGTNIEFNWFDGDSNGGTDITAYTVFYDISGFDRYRALKEIDIDDDTFKTPGLTELTLRFDTAEQFPLIGLDQISFKVSAKNEVGLSQQSEPIHYVKITNEETGMSSFIVKAEEKEEEEHESLGSEDQA